MPITVLEPIDPATTGNKERRHEANSSPNGTSGREEYPLDIQRFRAGDLSIVHSVTIDGNLHWLQRHEKATRIAQLANEWDDALVGVFTIHELIDHPTQPGITHVGDGGCRLRAKTDPEASGKPADPDYEFFGTREAVTCQESARRFLATNKDRKAVSKLDEFRVALTAQAPWAVALQGALDEFSLVADQFPSYGNGQPGKMAAVASCEVVVRQGAGGSNWEDGSTHLAKILSITRAAFRPGGVVDAGMVYAHDGDLIRALNSVIRHNPEKLSESRNLQRLQDTLQGKNPSWWKAESGGMSLRLGRTPGSGGRPSYLAALIVREFNKNLGQERRLRNPMRQSILDELG